MALRAHKRQQATHVAEACAVLRGVRRWWQLPAGGVWPQLGLLQSFHQIVELQESSRILVDLGQQRPDHQYSDLKARAQPHRGF